MTCPRTNDHLVAVGGGVNLGIHTRTLELPFVTPLTTFEGQ